jgi:hypothetical protein
VWLERTRSGRTAIDIAVHCNGSLEPRPRDPAVFPFVGFTVTGSGDVMIGGIPMPSLTNWVIGQAMKLAFKGSMPMLRRPKYILGLGKNPNT